MLVCDEPISVEWMLWLMNTVAGVVAAILPASSLSILPSAMCLDASRISSSRARLAGELIVIETNGLPSVVGPAVST